MNLQLRVFRNEKLKTGAHLFGANVVGEGAHDQIHAIPGLLGVDFQLVAIAITHELHFRPRPGFHDDDAIRIMNGDHRAGADFEMLLEMTRRGGRACGEQKAGAERNGRLGGPGSDMHGHAHHW